MERWGGGGAIEITCLSPPLPFILILLESYMAGRTNDHELVPSFAPHTMPLTSLKLGGERHLEAEEIRRSPGSFSPSVFPSPLEGHRCKVGN